MQYAPTFPEKDRVSSGRYYLLSRTIRDEYVFHSIMSNRLSDRYPDRGVLNTPHIDLTSTPPPFAERLVGRMLLRPTLPAEKSDLKGWRGVMYETRGDKYVFHFSMSNQLSDRCPCRGVLHTLLIDSTSTLSPLAECLVGRMQYAPTLPAEKSDLKGWCGVTFRRRGDEYVFLFSISNRLSDRYPGRAQKHTPPARLSSTPTSFAGRLVGRMQYAPTLSKKEEGSSGRYFPSSRIIRDEYVFHFSMPNRLSDRYPCRGVLNTPLARLSSTLSSLTGRLVGRKQYAPTFPEKDKVSSDRYFPSSWTIRDEYVFYFSMSDRLSDRYPGRAQKHTPLARLSSTLSPLAGRLVGRMQYAPTFPEKDKVSSGRYFLLSQTVRDQYVSLFSMSNRLSDRCPCRAQKHTPPAHLSSTLSPLTGRLVGRMQYVPTLSEKEEVSSGRCFLLSRTVRDKSVFHSSMSNRLSDRCPGRAQKHTPHNHSRKGYLITRQTIWGRMQYAPTLPAEKLDLKGWWEVMFGTMVDKYVFLFSMSNRLSDRYPGRAQKHTPLVRLSSTLSPFAGRLVGRMQYSPTLLEKEEISFGRCFPLSWTMADEYVFHFTMSNRLSDEYPGRAQKHTPPARLSSTPSPLAGRLVGRMQYAPTLPEKDKVSLGRCYLLSRTMSDKYVFHFSISNRLSDGYPGRGAKAYAPYRSNVYLFVPYGAFGRAYAIRPYIVEKR